MKFSRKSTDLVRLNKYIADSGLCSRRKADELIENGMVTINGHKVYEMGVKVDPEHDTVKVSGKVLRIQNDFVYFIFNKPTQVLTSMSDPSGRTTVADFFADYKKHRLFPVGRLDWDSEGLLIMTNDGDYSQKVTHPKEGIPKTYLVKINSPLTPGQVEKLKRGVSIVGGKVKAKYVSSLRKSGKSTDNHWASITITEGKNRQVRRMFEKLEIDVLKLRRVSIGKLKLGSLKKNEIRQITQEAAFKVFS